ncbi:MAG: hypothetical protein ACF8SC_10515 [Phycisphaerales bacterium JB037]
MNRAQRRAHLIAWLVLVPVLALLLAIGSGRFGGAGAPGDGGSGGAAVLDSAAQIAGEGSR